MRYDAERNRILLDATELVCLGQSESGARVSEDETELCRVSDTAEAEELTCERGGMRFSVTAYITCAHGDRILFEAESASPVGAVSRTAMAYAKGMAFAGAYVYAVKQNLQTAYVTLKITHGGEICALHEQTLSHATLMTFFYKLLDCALEYGAPEIDRVCRRLPTMAHAVYPFSSLREGQSELISRVYSAVRQKKHLFACAPTGIGKTMSVLFGAVRAMGDGGCEKIFYLTSKNTGSYAAAEAVRQMYGAKTLLRAVQMASKESLCPMHLMCKDGDGRCELSASAPSRIREAAKALLSADLPVVTGNEISETAKRYRVCPYETALTYSEMCDVVICDYNYLFDLQVFFKRYFSSHGHWCFLVDEAHNLPDRARDAYGITLSPEALISLGQSSAVPSLAPLFEEAARGLSRLIQGRTEKEFATETNGVRSAFASDRQAPDGLQEVLQELSRRCFECAESDEAALTYKAKRAARNVGYELSAMADKLSLFDSRFITFYTQHGNRQEIRILCLDPSEILRSRLALGDSAIFFSATLHPAEYYKRVLGGDEHDAVAELESPFDTEHMCIAVMDKLPVRWSVRSETAKQVVRVILTTVRAKPGNYMVFCPSFAYEQALYECLRKAAPGLPTVIQTPTMSEKERKDFLDCFSTDRRTALVGFCVMGGIYGEGIDLAGRRLIGAVVVGVGLPGLSDERQAMREYYDLRDEDGAAYAYTYPGLCRVMQAAGRVIRSENDCGAVVLIDERFAEPGYRKILPSHWRSLKYVGNTDALAELLRRFWSKEDVKKALGFSRDRR